LKAVWGGVGAAIAAGAGATQINRESSMTRQRVGASSGLIII
jgi:hypothetical protein